MLGRLELDVERCIEKYATLSAEVFEKKKHRVNWRNRQAQGRFDSATLERKIKDIVNEFEPDGSDALLQKPNKKCKVLSFPRQAQGYPG
jgi:hypothetical protein